MDGILIGDDDDDVLEENDVALQEADDDAASVSAADSSSEAADDAGFEVDKLTQVDFALLPYIAELVQAHRAGDAQTAELKLAALRRAGRRVSTRLAALQHVVTGPAAEPTAALALLEAREALLVGTKRKLESGR